MVDLERTAKEYADKEIPFPEDKASELGRVQKWKHQVTSEAGNFNQNPDDKTIQYPKRIPTQIIRKKLLNEDGREVLTTIETWHARDGIGNEVRLPVSEPQAYDTPIVRRHREYRDGRDVVLSEADGYERKYTVDFTPESFNEAYNRARKSMVSLLVQEDGLGRKEVKVNDPQEFVQREFYDLLDRKPKSQPASTPTTPTDPGFGSAANRVKETTTKKPSVKVSTIEGEVVAE